MRVKHTLHTDGNGLWSSVAKVVDITRLELGYEDDSDFNELRVYFDCRTWSVDRHGLIYTDRLFEQELKTFLNTLGLDSDDVSYSEQGMQGDNYVSCDVGEKFLSSWRAINS